MSADWVREVCLSFPHTTESVQWGDHLVFKIGGKMFAITTLHPNPKESNAKANVLSLKVNSDNFAELTERPEIIPAPYSARYGWIALESWQAMPRHELKRLLREAYDLVLEKLPKKARAALEAS